MNGEEFSLNYQYENIKDYLELVHPSFMKEYLWTMLFLIDSMGIITIISDPFTQFLFNILAPVIAGINLWAFYILLNMKKRQKQYILFVGVFCFVMSVILMLFSFKIIYLMLLSDSPFFALYAIAIYLAILVGGSIFHIKALENGYYSGKKKIKGKSGINTIVGMAVAGTLGGLFLINFASEDTGLVVLALALLFLGYLLELGINNIHKYYHIKKFENVYPNDKTKTLKK